MSLTIGTVPGEVITNDPSIDVTTSLTEGSSYQNLRIRATIYIGGQTAAVSVLEQKKGLDTWDFYDLLKRFIGKCNKAVGGSDVYAAPTLGSELLTGWTQYASLFTTFTTSGRQITSAISTSPDYAKSNDLGSAAIGDVYIVGLENDYADAGAIPVLLAMSEGDDPLTAIDLYAGYSGLDSGVHYANHIYIFCMPYADTTPFVYLGNQAGSENFEGTFTIKKISDFKNNPGVYFTIKFQEVYENSSNVTTIGATKYSQSYLFVPVAVRPGESFTDYLISTTSKKFLTRAEDGDMRYKFGIGMEARLMAITTAVYVKITVTTGVGNQSGNVQGSGWVMGILNDNIASLSAIDDDASVILISTSSAYSASYYTATAVIYCEVNCYPDIKALSFIGDLGPETLLFRGLQTISGRAEKSYYLDRNRIRKTLRAYKRKMARLRTLYETTGVRKLIHELLYTDVDVWMFDEDFTAGYRNVTVITDEADIEDQNELYETEIDVEYYE